MAKSRKKRGGHKGHHRKNPRRGKGRRHHRRRNPPGVGIGKVLVYAGLGLLAGAVAFGAPEIANLTGAKAYIPGGAGVAVGAVLAKKRPLLGVAIAGGSLAGMLAPWLAAKALPAPQNTSAVISALGNRVDAARMAAVIEGIGDPAGFSGPLEPRADTLTRGY